MRIASADAAAILDFLADVRDMGLDEVYPEPVLGRLTGLIAADAVLYAEFDIEGQTMLGGIEFGPDVGEGPDDEARYWAASPCPITEYRMRTRDGTALRMSDLVSWRRYRATRIYSEYYHPLRSERLLEMGISLRPRHHRSLAAFRAEDTAEFSERDRDVLEALRPHLQAREARAELLRRLDHEVDDRSDGDPPHPFTPLTQREREIIHLVGIGMTNARIAAQLWVTPATVKKHLENVYEKLGVGNRAAAASRLRAQRTAG